MYKFVIIAFILVSVSVHAVVLKQCEVSDSLVSLTEHKTSLDFQTVDSLTYQYYLTGKWNELIKTGKEAIRNQIDYKRLRQRIGYAYFMKADYYAAMKQYEAALVFDKTDLDTRAYLYYCGINTGNESYSRYQAGKLPVESQQFLGEKPFKVIDAIDLEYNYKSNDSQIRSNPNYWRVGCSTKLSYQLSLYQAFSSYSQNLDSTGTEFNFFSRSAVTQNEYYAGLSWKPAANFEFLLGYHYINSRINDSVSYKIPLIDVVRKDTILQTGNMFFGKIAFKYNRLDLGLSASLLTYNKILTQQYTLQAGISLPGSLGIQLKSKVDVLFDNAARRLIFTQTAGLIPLKNVWIEGNVTLGNLNNYADYNGLYILNSKDPTTFKTGVSIFWQALNRISIFANYGYDIKQLKGINNTFINYNQQSFSGGIIWKI